MNEWVVTPAWAAALSVSEWSRCLIRVINKKHRGEHCGEQTGSKGYEQTQGGVQFVICKILRCSTKILNIDNVFLIWVLWNKAHSIIKALLLHYSVFQQKWTPSFSRLLVCSTLNEKWTRRNPQGVKPTQKEKRGKKKGEIGGRVEGQGNTDIRWIAHLKVSWFYLVLSFLLCPSLRVFSSSLALYSASVLQLSALPSVINPSALSAFTGHTTPH